MEIAVSESQIQTPRRACSRNLAVGVRAPWRVTSSTKRRVAFGGAEGNSLAGATHFSLIAAAASVTRRNMRTIKMVFNFRIEKRVRNRPLL